MRKLSLSKLGQKGQTSIEYVMMMAVVVALAVSIMGIVRERVLGPGGECPPGDKSILCSFENIFNRTDGFRYFSIKR
jgi:hypothetical protein